MASPRDGNEAGAVPYARRRVPLHFTIGYGSFTAALAGRVLSTSGPHVFWLAPGEYVLEGVLASDGTLGALIQISFTSFRPEGLGRQRRAPRFDPEPGGPALRALRGLRHALPARRRGNPSLHRPLHRRVARLDGGDVSSLTGPARSRPQSTGRARRNPEGRRRNGSGRRARYGPGATANQTSVSRPGSMSTSSVCAPVLRQPAGFCSVAV